MSGTASHMSDSNTSSSSVSHRRRPIETTALSNAESINTEFDASAEGIRKFLAGDVFYIRHIEA